MKTDDLMFIRFARGQSGAYTSMLFTPVDCCSHYNSFV